MQVSCVWVHDMAWAGLVGCVKYWTNPPILSKYAPRGSEKELPTAQLTHKFLDFHKTLNAQNGLYVCTLKHSLEI